MLVKKLGVVGAGQMGSGIAQVFAAAQVLSQIYLFFQLWGPHGLLKEKKYH